MEIEIHVQHPMLFMIVYSQKRHYDSKWAFALLPLFAAIVVEVSRGQETSSEGIAYVLVANERAQKMVVRLGHSLFGKYKGRINNYLSAEGYDAKQAERDLKARQEK